MAEKNDILAENRKVNQSLIRNARENNLAYGLYENSADVNDANRELILAMKEVFGNVYLGNINSSLSIIPGLKKYEGEFLYNFCCDFCTPVYDEKLDTLIELWNETGRVKHGILDAIIKRVENIGGKFIVWS